MLFASFDLDVTLLSCSAFIVAKLSGFQNVAALMESIAVELHIQLSPCATIWVLFFHSCPLR